MKTNKTMIAITAGEPAGVGYDILALAAQKRRKTPWLVFADPEGLLARARQLTVPLRLEPFNRMNTISCDPQVLTVWPTPSAHSITPGTLSIEHVPAVLAGLTQAQDYCAHHKNAALLTLPVHKGIINQAGITFTGHTEFFAARAKVPKVVMMFAAKQCRVALVTTHLPLNQVASAITAENLRATIEVLVTHLQQIHHIAKPRIFFCGLNPHAGEQGYLGREEIDIIEPTLADLRHHISAHLLGPFPADTLFQEKYLQQADVMVAMYHDQGLAPLKALYFGGIVNITCGLPFIRTSVDHGVALDVAGTGHVRLESFLKTVSVTEKLIRRI